MQFQTIREIYQNYIKKAKANQIFFKPIKPQK